MRRFQYRTGIVLFFLSLGSLFLLPRFLTGNPSSGIEVWLDRGDGAVYHSGEDMTVYFKVEEPSFVTIYNIDTDGHVHILYPYYPGMDNYVAGGKAYTIPGGGYDLSLTIDEPIGMGYIEAVASSEPFDLKGWPFFSRPDEAVDDERVIQRISGDPFLAIEDINKEILPYSEEPDYRDDFATYYVEEVVHYPRYLCTDCHGAAYYHYEPYDYYCPDYYVVVYDYWCYNDFWYWDYYYPYYYPYGYYPYGYYDYYYYYPVPSHVGRRYSRKYDYRTRGDGIYRTKGETPLTEGVIRVGGYDGAGGSPVYIDKDAVRTVDGGASGGSPLLQRKTTVDESVGSPIPRMKAPIIEGEGQDRPTEESVVRRGDGLPPSTTAEETRIARVMANEGVSRPVTAEKVGQEGERVEGSRRDYQPRSSRPARDSAGGRSYRPQGHRTVSEERGSRHTQRMMDRPARSAEVRPSRESSHRAAATRYRTGYRSNEQRLGRGASRSPVQSRGTAGGRAIGRSMSPAGRSFSRGAGPGAISRMR